MYNVEKYIERCAISLLNQTLNSIELIFVDDGSTDNTIHILRETITRFKDSKCRVKIIQQTQNAGPSRARNRGLMAAAGEYIIYCDSDDWVDKDMYDKLYHKAVYNNLDLVWCDFIMHFHDHQSIVSTIDEQVDKIKTLKSYISYGWNICVNLLVKREVYVRGQIQWCESVCFNEDYDISVRFYYYADRIAKQEGAFYHYDRTNEDSIVHYELDQKKKLITATNELYVCNRVNDFFREKGLWEHLEKELCWRMLKAKRHLLYDSSQRDYYLSVLPESNKYISSNPLCRKIDKLSQKLIVRPWTARLIPIVKIIDHAIKRK